MTRHANLHTRTWEGPSNDPPSNAVSILDAQSHCIDEHKACVGCCCEPFLEVAVDDKASFRDCATEHRMARSSEDNQATQDDSSNEP